MKCWWLFFHEWSLWSDLQADGHYYFIQGRRCKKCGISQVNRIAKKY